MIAKRNEISIMIEDIEKIIIDKKIYKNKNLEKIKDYVIKNVKYDFIFIDKLIICLKKLCKKVNLNNLIICVEGINIYIKDDTRYCIIKK